MLGSPALQATIKAAAAVLSERWGAPTRLKLASLLDWYEGAPSSILRCQVSSDYAGAPLTIIVKKAHIAHDGPFFEAAALGFLDEVFPGLTPHLLGLLPEERALILEDLAFPRQQLLGEILFAHDGQRAEAALLALQRKLAMMHLATRGHEARYRRQLVRWQPQQRTRHRINSIAESLAAFPAMLHLIQVESSPDARGDIDEALAIVQRAGPFRTLVHGDATPANACYGDDGSLRLFDLETAQFHHALLDGTYSRLRYLHSVWARLIPLTVQRRLMIAYRQAFLADSSIDDAEFDRALVACSAAWLAGLCANLPGAIEKDRKWGRSTMRQRIVAALEHFQVLSEELGMFRPLAATCGQALAHLRAGWPEEACRMETYPAFADLA